MNNDYEFNLIPTNTLASGAFDVLKLDGVEDPFTNILSLSAINMEESYISSMINFLNEMNNEFVDNKMKLYREMVGTDNSTVVLESFSDYYVKVDDIIQKTLKFLRYKIDSFISSIENFMDETKIIDSHKKALMDEIKYYTSDSREGYTYTINENIPDLSGLDSFNASLFDDLYKPMVNDLSSDSVSEAIAALDLEKDVSIFRARVLNSIAEHPEGLNTQEFERMMYLIFRDNSSHMIELDIDAKDIKNIAEKWFKHYELKSTLNKDYNAIKKSLESVLDKIEKITNNNNNMSVGAFTNLMPGDIKVEKIEGKDIDNNGMMMSPDMMIRINIYTKAKIDQLHKYTDIICMVIGAKLDAIKSMIQQDRAILLDAIEVLDKPDVYYDARQTPKASSVDEAYLSEAKYSKGFYKAAVKARNGKPLTPKDVAEIIKAGFTPENVKDAIKGGKNLVKNKKNKKAVSEGIISDIRGNIKRNIIDYPKTHAFYKENKQFLHRAIDDCFDIVSKELLNIKDPISNIQYLTIPKETLDNIKASETIDIVGDDIELLVCALYIAAPEDYYKSEFNKVVDICNRNPKIKKYGYIKLNTYNPKGAPGEQYLFDLIMNIDKVNS